MPIQSCAPNQNYLLNALSADELERISPHLELAQLSLGEVLFEEGEELHYAYFPVDSIISLLYLTESGASTEIAVVGSEGVVGVALFMTGRAMQNRTVVQSTGYSYRIQKKHFMQEFDRHEELFSIMLKYVQVLLTQMAQTAVCNRHHSIDQQLCRWLLMSLDRLHSNELLMTQELIANMLGVRREGITEAAKKLQQAGLIQYRRGHITVVDREGLEERVCECYEVVQHESERLLEMTQPPKIPERRIHLVRYPAIPETSKELPSSPPRGRNK